MSIKSIKTEVTRVDTFKIEIDETIWNKEALKDWSNTFFEVETVEDLAKHLAQLVARLGSCEFYEGFGRVQTYIKDGYKLTQYVKNDKENAYEKCNVFCKGIELFIISEDNDCEVEIIQD